MYTKYIMNFDFVHDDNNFILEEMSRYSDATIKDIITKGDIKSMENILDTLDVNDCSKWNSFILLRLCSIGSINIISNDPEIILKTELKNKARLLINKYYDAYFA